MATGAEKKMSQFVSDETPEENGQFKSSVIAFRANKSVVVVDGGQDGSDGKSESIVRQELVKGLLDDAERNVHGLERSLTRRHGG